MIEGKYPDNWKYCKFRDVVLRFKSGGTPSTKIESYWVGDIPWVTGADFLDGKIVDIRRFINEDAVKNSATNLIPKGNLLLVTRTGVGKLAIAHTNIAISQDITGIMLSEDVDPHYAYWYFMKNIKVLKSLNQGTSINGIVRSDLENFIFIYPDKKEQQKIADILATVDETIDETSSIMKACERIKKGLMQTLLMKGLPGWHKKFKKTKIGDIPKNWKYCKFKDAVLKFKNGGTPSTKIKSYWEGDIPWVTGADFLDGKIVEFRKFINEDAVKNSATNVIPKGNLLIVTRTGVGKLAIAHTDIAISQDITGIMLSEDVDPHYAYWYFMKNIKILKSLNQGTSINGIIRSDLENFIFIYPDKNEQQEIVSILSIFVDRIESEKQKKSQLEILKKGLMQKLLTGEVRVKVN